MDWQSSLERHRRTLLGIVLLAALALVAIGILALSWTLAGPLSTIIYATLFIVGATLLPGMILLFGRATPFGTGIGTLHFVLAQFIADHGWFVQVGEDYYHCPGTHDEFYLDGAWYEIEEGDVNRSVLGWRPFGIVWLPDADRLLELRVDSKAAAETGAVADGGSDVERAGLPQAPTPTVDTDSLLGAGDTGATWLVDLKALYRSGLARAGNMDLVSTKEEQTMRDEVDGGAVDRWASVIMFLVGLPMGAAIGYMVILA